MWAKLICEKINFVYLLIRFGNQHSYAVFVSFYDSQRQEESWKIYGQVVVTLRLASQWFECRNYILLCSLIIWIRIVLRRTVVASDCWTV